ncbi:hypothetical protein JCM14469_42310 [Desulfatiferula olefinivorans]
MGIIRFEDETGRVRTGVEGKPGAAGIIMEHGALTGETARIGRRLAPVDPRALICIGLNYRDHARETGAALPDFPVVFMKNPASVIGPGEPIVLPRSCRDPHQTDYEVELAVVIGKPAKNVSEDEALSYVKGYTVANDVSARIWQKKGGGGQWVRGKSFDTFCPLGPVLVPAKDIPDPNSLSLSLTLNGRVMQQGSTSDMIFSVKSLIAYLSEDTTLLPDTVILTGTPGGVGFTRTPPVFLRPGDHLSLTIESIGTLENQVV